MAIYHFSMKTFSRSKGQTATASIAYRAGAKIECEREGVTHNYTRKQRVLHSEIVLPINAPEWATDRQILWNEVEKTETRKNSTVAREFEVALPHELTANERIALVQDFAQQIVNRHGCAVDFSLHDDYSRSRQENHHAHIMLSTRKLEDAGFTKKTRELDQKTSGEIHYWREQWAKTTNEHLRWYQIVDSNNDYKQIDHRSLEDQGLQREPTKKLGRTAHALEKKGIKTDKGNHNRAVQSYNDDKVIKLLAKIEKQANEFSNKSKFVEKRLQEYANEMLEKNPVLHSALVELDIYQKQEEQPTQLQAEKLEQIDQPNEPQQIEEPTQPPEMLIKKEEQLLANAYAVVDDYSKMYYKTRQKIINERTKPYQEKINELEKQVQHYNNINNKPIFTSSRKWHDKRIAITKEKILYSGAITQRVNEISDNDIKKQLNKEYPKAYNEYTQATSIIYSHNYKQELVRQEQREQTKQRTQENTKGRNR